jgi:hypothetical protein
MVDAKPPSVPVVEPVDKKQVLTELSNEAICDGNDEHDAASTQPTEPKPLKEEHLQELMRENEGYQLMIGGFWNGTEPKRNRAGTRQSCSKYTRPRVN